MEKNIDSNDNFTNHKFSFDLINEIMMSIGNHYNNNFDYYRFGRKNTLLNFLKSIVIKRLSGRLLTNIRKSFLKIQPHLTKFKELHDNLADQNSKDLLVKILSYRILGFRKVKLPLNTKEYWGNLRELEKIADKSDQIAIKFHNWKLKRISLKEIGFPIEVYQRPPGVNAIFLLNQYEYKTSEIFVGVDEGDVIIDAGGCWGDTAIYFAYKAGRAGKVYTFEFIPSNLEIMKKNISINPIYKSNIHIIENPIWDQDGKPVFFYDNGPGSKISFEKAMNMTGGTITITIDNFVKTNNIGKIDFIKMDIEGAEQPALKGSIETINKFRPKLAISVYHNLDDFVNIYKLINSLNLGYSFYLGHSSLHREETILFALP